MKTYRFIIIVIVITISIFVSHLDNEDTFTLLNQPTQKLTLLTTHAFLPSLRTTETTKTTRTPARAPARPD